MAFFSAVGWSISSLTAHPEGETPGPACQVPWAVPRARCGYVQGELHPSWSQRSSETFTASSVSRQWSVSLLTQEQSSLLGRLPPFCECRGVGDAGQGGTDGNHKRELYNCRAAVAEGTSGDHGAGPGLMLDEAAQGPVQLSYL